MENWRSQDDKVSGRMWKAVEAEARETGVAKTKERGSERRSRKKKRDRKSVV